MECDEAVAVGVRGTIAAAAIGDTLPHERVIYTLHSLYRPPPSLELHALRDEPITLRALNTLRTHPFCSLANLSSPGMDVLANEISLFRRAVGSNAATIVDVTLAHEGRDPAALVALSVSTGVSIVMSTGCAPHVLDAIARARDESEREEQVEALIGRMVSELTKGVDATQPAVRAGVIAGAILEPRNELLPILAAVQLRTSAPLLGYLPKPLCSQDAPPAERAKASAEAAASAVASLERLTTLGVSAAKILVLHGQHLLPLAEGMYELLRTGASVCFDSLGNTWCAAGAVGARLLPASRAALRPAYRRAHPHHSRQCVSVAVLVAAAAAACPLDADVGVLCLPRAARGGRQRRRRASDRPRLLREVRLQVLLDQLPGRPSASGFHTAL
eukprot:CAMPEP_0183358708 /NCGR_PEP_ID=MMETSP0164_2-20130417/50026_1 /TAXON_ID=221442 /ORGANISM="Coccolithus pelagicus ssp braarudi, Strain PLY182g" /LENGTH=388 /DNA_ID=CAMNT_0025532649 /DNA_START=20 /DNA_END=1186 /DNA_ORIENTATION=+